MSNTIKEFLALGNNSAQAIARAISLGIFIACTPFIGFHTMMIFAMGALFHCNVAIVFTVVYLISNPITMVPLLAIGYIFGQWFFSAVLGLNLLLYNPAWMDWFNRKIGHYLVKYLGIDQLCFWCFILGGTLFAAIIAIIAYPIVLKSLTYINKKKLYENNNTK